ncbi:unnamed protein product, partial [Coregonus sp. 'balchen']
MFRLNAVCHKAGHQGSGLEEFKFKRRAHEKGQNIIVRLLTKQMCRGWHLEATCCLHELSHSPHREVDSWRARCLHKLSHSPHHEMDSWRLRQATRYLIIYLSGQSPKFTQCTQCTSLLVTLGGAVAKGSIEEGMELMSTPTILPAINIMVLRVLGNIAHQGREYCLHLAHSGLLPALCATLKMADPEVVTLHLVQAGLPPALCTTLKMADPEVVTLHLVQAGLLPALCTTLKMADPEVVTLHLVQAGLLPALCTTLKMADPEVVTLHLVQAGLLPALCTTLKMADPEVYNSQETLHLRATHLLEHHLPP